MKLRKLGRKTGREIKEKRQNDIYEDRENRQKKEDEH